MIIKEVITLAKYSELHGVAAKNDVDAIVAFINLGMLEIYKRFPIKVEEHIIDLEDNVAYYEMPSNFMYAVGAFGEEPEKSKQKATEIAINNEDDCRSIFFTDWNTVQVPAPITGSYISIIYIAKPAPVTADQVDDGTVLDLPDTLVEVLLSYIGYRGHLGVKSDSQSENNAHWARFERSCKKVRELGVAFPMDSMSMSERIRNRGFV